MKKVIFQTMGYRFDLNICPARSVYIYGLQVSNQIKSSEISKYFVVDVQLFKQCNL